jgi:hypothetical protein
LFRKYEGPIGVLLAPLMRHLGDLMPVSVTAWLRASATNTCSGWLFANRSMFFLQGCQQGGESSADNGWIN